MLLSHTPAKVALLGAGDSSDAHHISAPHPEGLGAEDAMNKALSNAGLTAEDIGYINAHGTATPLNDSMESKAIFRCFGDAVRVSSTKPLTGHTLGAASATEAAIAWHILNYDLDLPAQHCANKAEDIEISLVEAPSKLGGKAILSNSFAFGGNNVSLILVTLMTKLPPIEQLLPHDRPMILVDRAIDIQQDTIHCQVDIGEHNPFFNRDTQTVPAYVGIEFMAQSVAAWSGYHALIQGQEPPIGFLLGSRRYTSECDAFTQGQQLDVYAEKMMEDNGMAVFSARMEWQEKTIATCQLNVYVPSEEKLKEMKIRSQQ